RGSGELHSGNQRVAVVYRRVVVREAEIHPPHGLPSLIGEGAICRRYLELHWRTWTSRCEPPAQQVDRHTFRQVLEQRLVAREENLRKLLSVLRQWNVDLV